MTARYDIPRLQADCKIWFGNPVFPYPWQEKWRAYATPEFVIRDENDCVVVRFKQGFIPFAHMIGLDVESYRIKETYKTAVERYLETLKDGAELFPGLILRKFENALYKVHEIGMERPDSWVLHCPRTAIFGSLTAYTFLRLDLNPDYQVEP